MVDKKQQKGKIWSLKGFEFQQVGEASTEPAYLFEVASNLKGISLLK